MEATFINSAVIMCILWNINIVHTKPVCKPISNFDPDCQTACDSDPASTICRELCKCSGPANETCVAPEVSSIEVTENATEGTPLFQIPVTSGETWEYHLGRTESVDGTPLRKLQSYLKLLRFANKYEMVLNQPLDIESIYQDYGIVLISLLLKLTCVVGTTGGSETVEIFLIIKPVNEYAPEFTGPLELTVAEDAKLGDHLTILRVLAKDKDVNPSGAEIAYFTLWKYLSKTSLDGSGYFIMANTQQGSIDLQKTLDYETLRAMDATTLYLNVSATDSHGLTTFSVLTIHVSDVDDLSPEFYHPGCQVFAVRSKPCVVAYEVEIYVNYKGPLNKMFPYRVQARDMDFLNATITFALEEAPGQNSEVMEKFVINNITGQINLISPFQQPQIVRLVIVAMQPPGNTQTRYARASLQVSVIPEPEPIDGDMLRPSSTLTTRILAKDVEEEGMPLYLIITLVAGLLFLIVHIIICLICLKYKGDKRKRVSPLSPTGADDSVRFSSSGGMVFSNHIKPQAGAIETNSFLVTSEYDINQDGKVTPSKYNSKYASGLPQKGSNMIEYLPSLNRNNKLGLNLEDNGFDKNLSNSKKVKTDQELQNDTTNSRAENRLYINPSSQLFHDDIKEGLLRSNKSPLSSNVSSTSSNTQIVMSPESADEHNPMPDMANSQFLNDPAQNQSSLGLAEEEKEEFSGRKSEYRITTTIISHESREQPYLGNDSQNKGGAWLTEEMNTCIHENSNPSRSESETSLANMSNTEDDSKVDYNPSVKMINDSNTGNPGLAINESQGACMHNETPSIGHNALSIYPFEKFSTTTDETGPVLTLSNERTTQSNPDFTEAGGNTAHHVPHNESHTASATAQAELNHIAEEVNILRHDELENQHDAHRGKRKRKKKRAKAERAGKVVKDRNCPELDTRCDGLWLESSLGGENVARDKAKQQELFQRYNRNNGQSVIKTGGDVDQSKMTCRMNASLPYENFQQRATRSRKVSYESLHGTPMPDLKADLPPRSLSSIPYSLNKSARLDKSRLQPYMVLQHEKQREIKQQQQHEQQQKQTYERHKVQLQRQETPAYDGQNVDKRTKEEQMYKIHKRKLQQHRRHRALDQDSSVNESVEVSLEQNLAPQERLRHSHHKLRSVSVPGAVKTGREEAHTPMLPATAPPTSNSENAKNLRHGEEDPERDVRNWVNSTH